MKFIASLLAVGLVAMATNHALAQTDDETFLTAAARRSAAVAAILESPRETPAEQLAAVLTLVNLGETEVAAIVWKPLAKAELDDAASADLATQFGSARLMKLARLEQPAGKGAINENSEATPGLFVGAGALANQCIAAATEQARAPERLAKLIAQVNDPAAEARKAARVELAATGIDGAKACLEALAQTEEETQRANLMLAITGLQPAADPLLVAALADGKGHFRRDVAELCGYSRVDTALPFLAAIVAGAETDPEVISAAATALSKLGHTVPNDAEARALLMREIRRIEASAFNQPLGEQGRWWTWNLEPAPQKFDSHNYDLATTQTLAAERLAQMLLSCGDPTHRQRELALIYQFETLPIRGEENSRNPGDSYSTTEISNTLAAALKRNRTQAALSCVRILAARNDTSILISGTGRPSPLAAALSHGNRELRFAALEAIMKLAPERSFAGASRVPKTLWEFAAGAGPAQAVAASSVTLRADDWAAQLRGLGYDATPTYSGRAALLSALNSTRLELLLVDSDIDRPRVREIVYQLRSHEQTARVPVAVLSSLPNLKYAQQIAAADAMLLAVVRPHSEQAMQDILDHLHKLGDPPNTEEQRTAQAIQALQWIGKLLGQGNPYDELLRNADILGQTVHIPGLVEPSLRALAMAGTAGSQITLVDYASQRVHPLEARQLAANSFATSVEQHGKQLRLNEIRKQYERYNTSESADTETQQILGQILDILEDKSTQAASSAVTTPAQNP